MNETQFTTKFKIWFWENLDLFFESSPIECKVTKTNTFNLNTWRKKQGHQLINLRDAQNDTGVLHKISDQSSDTKPFDLLWYVRARSLLVIYYGIQKRFFILDYDYLITKISQTSISYKELEAELIAHELLKPKKLEIPDF